MSDTENPEAFEPHQANANALTDEIVSIFSAWFNDPNRELYGVTDFLNEKFSIGRIKMHSEQEPVNTISVVVQFGSYYERILHDFTNKFRAFSLSMAFYRQEEKKEVRDNPTELDSEETVWMLPLHEDNKSIPDLVRRWIKPKLRILEKAENQSLMTLIDDYNNRAGRFSWFDNFKTTCRMLYEILHVYGGKSLLLGGRGGLHKHLKAQNKTFTTDFLNSHIKRGKKNGVSGFYVDFTPNATEAIPTSVLECAKEAIWEG